MTEQTGAGRSEPELARSPTPGPGWYPDPARQSGSEADPRAGAAAGVKKPEPFRWWDGAAWTEHTANQPYAPSPPDPPPPSAPRKRRSRLFRTLVWAVVAALLLTVAAGGTMWLWVGPGPAATQSNSDTETAGGSLDVPTRRASIGPATMDLPPAPYLVNGETHKIPGVADPVFFAQATIHPRTDNHRAWSAIVCMAQLEPTLAAKIEFDEASGDALAKLARILFGPGASRVSKPDIAEHSVDGYSGVKLTARVHYQIAGLPNHYDDLTAIAVRLDDSSVVIAFSSVPNDADPHTRRLAAESLNTLRVD